MGMKSFEFDGAGGAELFRLLGILLKIFAAGKKKQFSVGKYAVDVEEEEFDLAGTVVSGQFWHWRDFSIWRRSDQGRDSHRIGKWRPSFSKSWSVVTRVA